MTIVACWLDNAYGVRSVAALADARASEKTGGRWHTHSDSTIKLFAVEVRCFHMDSLSPGLGAHIDPYYVTTIGIGFAGHCFEALTVIAHLQRAFGALSSLGVEEPLPTAEGLLNVAGEIARRYLVDHGFGAKRSLELLLFGWDSPDLPWAGKLVWSRRDGSVNRELHLPLTSQILTVGDEGKSTFFSAATRLSRKVWRRIPVIGGFSTEHDDLAKARLAVRASQFIEEGVGQVVGSEVAQSVGGVRQKLQIAWDCGRSVGAFTADDKPRLMDGLPSARNDAFLAPVPIIQKMR